MLKKFFITIVATVLFITLCEIVIESSGAIPAPPPPIAFWGPESDQDNLEGLASTFRPNYKWLWEPNPGMLFCGEKINKDGYRGRIFTQQKTAALRIITFGDSSTMGFGVRESESWPRMLESLLRAEVSKTGGRDVEVLNFGCVGYSAYQGEKVYFGRALDYHPDIVILAFGAINESFESQDGIGQVQRLQIIGSSSSRVRAFLQRFTLLRYLFLQFQSGRDAVPAPKTPARNLSVEEYKQSYHHILNQQKKDGRRGVLVAAPRRRSVEFDSPHVMEYTNATREAAAANGAPLADVYQFFRAREPEQERFMQQPLPDPWYLDSVHPSVEGHQQYAAVVAKVLIDNNLIR
ncbi:MAG: SGNH/GDSL hydrolase family protein [Planctomycetota bacterium]